MSKNEFDSESMLDIYIFETTQLIELLEISILVAEREQYYTEDSINEIFRTMHTIKGSSAMMEFNNISALAHAVEDVFFFIREESPKNINYMSLSELILNCIDCIKAEIEKIRNNHSPDGEFSKLTDRINDFLKKLKSHSGDSEVSDNPFAGSSEGESGQESQIPSESSNLSINQSMISVSVSKLDKLMDLVGELVIAEAMVRENPDLEGLELNSFHKSFRQLGKITHEIQDMVMSVRMVPLTATFQKMHRLVRDMSKKLNKNVKLEFAGEHTEVDKNVIEHISDPIMHLVRNAIDHGLESESERMEAGKEQTGTIILEAKNSGRDVLVKVRDDGRGLDADKIFERAKQNGILEKKKEEMDEKEILNLIFLPGFSTAEEVSEYSGRGVGMDVVVKGVEEIGGSVLVSSTRGAETVITLRIPLTIAIMNGMNIKAGNFYFTIPTTSIKEFFPPDEKDIIKDSQHHEMIMIRGRYYPILRLEEFYEEKSTYDESKRGIVIMVEYNDNAFCLFADELIGQQEVVVKPLPEYIRKIKRIKGLTGCTLLGNGRISLILDISELL